MSSTEIEKRGSWGCPFFTVLAEINLVGCEINPFDFEINYLPLEINPPVPEELKPQTSSAIITH